MYVCMYECMYKYVCMYVYFYITAATFPCNGMILATVLRRLTQAYLWAVMWCTNTTQVRCGPPALSTAAARRCTVVRPLDAVVLPGESSVAPCLAARERRQTHVYKYECMYVYVYVICECMYVFVCIYVCICMYPCIHV